MKRMMQSMENESKNEGKKVAVPPVDVGLPPIPNSVAIQLDGQELARRKQHHATLLRSTSNASSSWPFAISLPAARPRGRDRSRAAPTHLPVTPNCSSTHSGGPESNWNRSAQRPAAGRRNERDRYEGRRTKTRAKQRGWQYHRSPAVP